MPNRPDNAPTDLSRKHPPIWLVYEERGRGAFIRPVRTNPMDWTRVSQGVDGFQNKATLRVALRDEDLEKAGDPGKRHIGDIIGLGGILHPDLRVRIFQPGAPDDPPEAWLFEGYPMLSTASWTETSQSIEVSCISVAHERLGFGLGQHQNPKDGSGAMVTGRRMLSSAGYLWRPKNYMALTRPVPSLAVHFNAGGRPNRSPDKNTYFDKGNKHFQSPVKLFTFTEDGAPGAEFWSYVDALRYLLWWHVIVPGIDFVVESFMFSTDHLVGKPRNKAGKNQFDRLIVQRVIDGRVDSLSVEKAIEQLVTRAGLHYSLSIKVDPNGGPDGGPIHYLRVFPVIKPGAKEPREYLMGWPTTHDIPREAPFTPLDLKGRNVHAAMKASAVQQATITIDDHLINAATYLGGVKFYEVTLLLIPGWLPFRIYSGEGYKNYPGMSDEPSVNVLDDVDQGTLDDWNKPVETKKVKVIKDYWDKGDPEKSQPTVDKDGKQVIPWRFDKRHPDFKVVAEVGRKWVYPTDARYAAVRNFPPETSLYWRTYKDYIAAGLLTYDPTYKPKGAKKNQNRLTHPRYGGGIADAKEWVARRRMMGSPISRFPGGTKLSAWVEMKIKGNPLENVDWLRLTGGADVSSTEESAITVTMNNPMAFSTRKGEYHINENWFIWIARQMLYVRVTCLIEGDERLSQFVQKVGAPVTRKRVSVIDVSERFRFRDRGVNLRKKGFTTNSILARLMPDRDPDPEFESVDDTNALEEYAREEINVLALEKVSGDPEIPWIAFDIGSEPLMLGDVFRGANGVGLTFADPPELVNITYENRSGAGYRTLMHLSDLRNDPTLLLETGD